VARRDGAHARLHGGCYRRSRRSISAQRGVLAVTRELAELADI